MTLEKTLRATAFVVVMTGPVTQGLAADAAPGKAVYDKNCAGCHAADGKVNMALAKTLGEKGLNIVGQETKAKSDDELLKTIEHGVVFSPMHSWRGQLTDGEMQDVVAYIRVLSQQGP